MLAENIVFHSSKKDILVDNIEHVKVEVNFMYRILVALHLKIISYTTLCMKGEQRMKRRECCLFLMGKMKDRVLAIAFSNATTFVSLLRLQ